MHIKLTKSVVDAIDYLAEGQVFIRDSVLRGFALRVGKTKKTYICELRARGITTRSVLGEHGRITCEQARAEALQRIAQMAQETFVKPSARKTASTASPKLRSTPPDLSRDECITLIRCFDTYLVERPLKPRTKTDYRWLFGRAFGEWSAMDVRTISRTMVADLHRTLTQTMGAARANYALRMLRALLNFAAVRFESAQGDLLIAHNPVARLSQAKAWNRVRARTEHINAQQLPRWFDALLSLRNSGSQPHRELVRDWLIVLVLTGLRRSEASSLAWADVDLDAALISIRDTKNGDDHLLPCGPLLLSVLRNRASQRVNGYVFGLEVGKSGFLSDPRKQMLQIIDTSGVTFRPHDLRRSFISFANDCDIGHYTLKRLLNHRARDVTGGYIQISTQKLRQSMTTIEAYILRQATKTVADYEAAGVVANRPEIIELSGDWLVRQKLCATSPKPLRSTRLAKIALSNRAVVWRENAPVGHHTLGPGKPAARTFRSTSRKTSSNGGS